MIIAGPGTLAAQNYSFNLVNGTLKVVAAPPTVTNVVVASAVWPSTYLSSLAAQNSMNVGGYSIPVGSGSQLVALPWANIDQIKVAFSENVAVDQADLKLSGVNLAQYAFKPDLPDGTPGDGFVYDPNTFTATWTLAQPIAIDKLFLALNADGSSPIEDTAGNRLDGEWTNPTSTAQSGTSTYPSGDGTGGGNFLFRFNVLSGDASQDGTVGLADLNTVLSNYGKSGMTWTQGDFTGDEVVGLADLNNVLTDYGKTLPSGEPTAGSFPADALLVAASVPTVVSRASAISVRPVTTVDAPATSSGAEAAVAVMASVDSFVAISQPAYLVSDSQPTARRSPSAQVCIGPSPLIAASSPITPPGTPLTLHDLKPVVGEPVAHGAGGGLNAATLQKPTRGPFAIGNLPSSSLGEAAGNRAYLATNTEASTPAPNKQPLPTVDPRVVDRMDLGAVAAHELGPFADSSDFDALTDDMLSGVPGSGIGRNVAHLDAVLASL